MNIIKTLQRYTTNEIPEGFSVRDITCNSRNVADGTLFFATAGETVDGHMFIPESIKNGAAAIVAEKGRKSEYENMPIPVFFVRDTKEAFAECCSARFLFPSRQVKVIGITGTNGKTTTAFLLRHILNRTKGCGLLSTVVYDTGRAIVDSHYTTPDVYEVNRYIAEMREAHCAYCVMEVSSHALRQGRVDGIKFDTTLFTNLTQDHLDYHETMEEYFSEKKKLFSGKDIRSIINNDDAYGKRLIEIGQSCVTYGIINKATYQAADICCTDNGLTFSIITGRKKFHIKSSLLCKHNVYNIIAAFSYACEEGLDHNLIIEAIKDFPGVPGRVERIDCGQPFTVLLDYAHTPDAFMNVLSSVKEIAKRKIITVFGCGGDRDRGKRPRMARAASVFSDHVVITNDNPRFEDERQIIKDIEAGVEHRDDLVCEVIPDRREAITKALRDAGHDDIILILGKGHEEYIIRGDERIHFSDREVVKDILNDANYCKSNADRKTYNDNNKNFDFHY